MALVIGWRAGRPATREKNSTHLCLFVLTSPGRDASPELAEVAVAKPVHRAAIAYSYRKRLELESDVSNVGQPVQAAALKQPHDRVPDHRSAVVLGAPPHAASRVA